VSAVAFNVVMPLTPVGRHLRHALGTAVHDGRTRLGWSQQDLARRAGVSRSMVAMVETGRVNLTVDAAGQLMTSLGIALRLQVDTPFVAGRQRDAVHAACVGQARRRLDRDSWETASEVEIVDGRARGFIDLLAFDPETRLLLVLEIKSELDDLGQLERTLNWSCGQRLRRLGGSDGRRTVSARRCSSSRATITTRDCSRIGRRSAASSRFVLHSCGG
jgi:transcriptional regulator with XRE-family HTH domain